MEWELSLYLIAANVPINHKCIYSARERQKQEHGGHELVRVQPSVLRGNKGTRRWGESLFSGKLESRSNTEPGGQGPGQSPSFSAPFSLEGPGSAVPGNISGSTLPGTSPPNRCPELLPQQHWSLLRRPEVKSEVASVSLPMSPRRQGRLPRAPWIFPGLLGLSCIPSTQDPIPSSPGSEARLLAL